MREKKQIVQACFIAGCTTVGLLLVLNLSLLNILISVVAGFCAGYLSYEFKEVLQAIPEAFWATVDFGRETWYEAVDSSKKWFKESHPFFALYVSSTVFFTIWWAYLLRRNPNDPRVILVYFSGLFGSTIVPFTLLPLFTWLGARYWDKSFWRMKCYNNYQISNENKRCDDLYQKGLTQKELTYANAYRWMAEGLLITLFWSIIGPFFIGYHVIRFVIKFVWHLFRLIHSYKRVLCGVDGVISGLVARIYFASPAMSAVETAAVIMSGGLLGAAFGLLNYKFWQVLTRHFPQFQLKNS